MALPDLNQRGKPANQAAGPVLGQALPDLARAHPQLQRLARWQPRRRSGSVFGDVGVRVLHTGRDREAERVPRIGRLWGDPLHDRVGLERVG